MEYYILYVSVDLGIQHVKCMALLLYEACLALPNPCRINGTIKKKRLGDVKCVLQFSLQLLSETILILQRMQVNCYHKGM